MKLRTILAKQIRTRLDRSLMLNTQMKLKEAAGVTQSTVGRTLDQSASATIDTVESYAKAFRVSPIALLATEEESVLLDCYHNLTGDEKSQVLAFMKVTLSARESNMQTAHSYWMNEQPIKSGIQAATRRATDREPESIKDGTHATGSGVIVEQRKQRHTA
jgi:hypothetical protein